MRACAVEIHVNISQEPFCTEIYRKNAWAQSEDPDKAPAFKLSVRTPQDTLCGEERDSSTYHQENVQVRTKLEERFIKSALHDKL